MIEVSCHSYELKLIVIVMIEVSCHSYDWS